MDVKYKYYVTIVRIYAVVLTKIYETLNVNFLLGFINIEHAIRLIALCIAHTISNPCCNYGEEFIVELTKTGLPPITFMATSFTIKKYSW